MVKSLVLSNPLLNQMKVQVPEDLCHKYFLRETTPIPRVEAPVVMSFQEDLNSG